MRNLILIAPGHHRKEIRLFKMIGYPDQTLDGPDYDPGQKKVSKDNKHQHIQTYVKPDERAGLP